MIKQEATITLTREEALAVIETIIQADAYELCMAVIEKAKAASNKIIDELCTEVKN